MRLAGRAAACAAAAVLVPAATAPAAVIGTWSPGTTGNWNNTAPSGTTGGWTNGAIPNGVGDTASLDNGNAAGSSTTNQNIAGGVTVGTISSFGTTTSGTDRSWTIAAGTNGITMNQDGAGPGTATISHSLSAAGNPGNSMVRITGTLRLADDLFISNTSNSVRANGSVQIQSTVTGTGNITLFNAGGSGPSAGDAKPTGNDPAVGAIAFSAGGSYVGNTTIRQGAVTYTRGDSFSPNPANVVTIGTSGFGAATLAFAGTSLGNMENNIVAAAGTTGPLVFATTAAQAGAVTIKASSRTSSVTLNGDLTFSNPSATGQLLVIGNPIQGVGRLTKAGAGPMEVTDTNTYQGGTVIAGGSLAVNNAAEFNNGFGLYPATVGTLGTGDVTVNATAVRLELKAGVAGVNVIADTATVSLFGGGAANIADAGYLLLNSGVNEMVGTLLLGGVAQPVGTYGSTASGATFKNDEYFSGPGTLNVTQVPEPASLSVLALGAAGLLARGRRGRGPGPVG